MSDIFCQSPTRVDLAGGTLDCPPLFLFLNNPVTVNVAIDIMTSARIRIRTDQKIHLISLDQKLEAHASSLSALLEARLESQYQPFTLAIEVIQYFLPKTGFELTINSESPIGGGLGGSSSLCISLLKAFNQLTQQSFGPYEMVQLASQIEARVLLKPTGTQDYFPPIFSGVNFIQYFVRGPSVSVMTPPQELFKGRFLLVYTGRSHHSGINNWQVIKSYLDGDLKTQKSMLELAKISKEMAELLQQAGASDNQASVLERLPLLFADEYKARTELSEGFSSPEIKDLQQVAATLGGIAKICGAGGGGCVLVWCTKGNSDEVAKAVRAKGYEVLKAQPFWYESGQNRHE